MKYTKFVIKNYKGIPEIELDLNKKPTSNIFTLVGLNESGKTSLLEAIYLFQNGIFKKKAHTLIPKSKQYSFNGEISIKAELELNEDELINIKALLKKEHRFHIIDSNSNKIIKIKKIYHFKNSIPIEKDDSNNGWEEAIWEENFKGKTKQSKQIKELYDWKKDAWNEVINLIQKKFLPKILYYPNFLFEFPEKIYLEQFKEEEKGQEEYRNVIQDILVSIGKGLTIKDHLLERIKSEKAHKEALEQLLLRMSSKLNEEILTKWDTIFTGTQKKEVIISADTELETGRHFIKLKIKQGSASYSINDRSLGFRWFFSFLIFTAFRKTRIKDPGETLFLLDEPASNLHQSSQKKLLHSLENIVSDCKLIYSTHSHHLIDPKWLAGTYIVRNEAINYESPEESSTTETNISATLYKNFVARYPKEEDHFKPILDALDYTPSKLEMVPSIIFTEGKSDYYTFKYMAHIIFKDEYKLNFYPGAGVNKYKDPFRLYLAWDKKFIALFDSDEGGRKAKEQYIADIGRDIENKIFTFEDIKSEWKEIEAEKLFSREEQVKVTQSCFSDYEEGDLKSKFNASIQNLYIKNKEFDFNQETLNKFKKIFDFLQEKIK
ncbi:MAG: AAA family ATPase [Bdellovibrionales bacterium]|nr:AAA family ATPase [Bdellovibrionales bacterium]